MSWIDHKKVKANARQLVSVAAVLAVSGVAAWYSGRFLAFLIGIGIVAVLIVISVVNYWVRNRRTSN